MCIRDRTYTGRVVNVTKFGAFVNILPGRDGLLHISKIGGGKRIDKVEDVLDLGDTVEVRVDDVDPNGKVSLSLASAVEVPEGASSSSASSSASDAPARDDAPAASGNGAEREYVSFEDAFDSEITAELGDLGPAGDDRGGERRGGSGGGRGGRRGGSGGGGGRR